MTRLRTSLTAASICAVVTAVSACARPPATPDTLAVQRCLELQQAPVGADSQPLPGYYFDQCIREVLSALPFARATGALTSLDFECRPSSELIGVACYRSTSSNLPFVSDTWFVHVREQDSQTVVESTNHYSTGF